MQILNGHTKEVRSVTFAPDGRLVSGGGDRKVIIWDPVGGKALETIKAKGVVYATAVSADSKSLAFAGRAASSNAEANSVKLWDLVKNQLEREFVVLRSHYKVGSVWSLSFSADGEYLAAASRISASAGALDGTHANWWQTRPPFKEGVFPEGRVYAVRFAPSGTTIALALEGHVALVEMLTGAAVFSYRLQSTWAAGLAFVPGDSTLIIGASSLLHFVDTQQARMPRRVKSGFRTITSVAVSPDGNALLVGGWPETLEYYNLRTQSLLRKLDFELGTIHSVAFSPDGCTFAIGADKGLMICDVP